MPHVSLWSKVYPLSHHNFDADFDNCLLLINLLLETTHLLQNDDLKFYRSLLESYQNSYTQTIEKRKLSAKESRKKAKLDLLTATSRFFKPSKKNIPRILVLFQLLDFFASLLLLWDF